MTIEVRQMVVKAEVGDGQPPRVASSSESDGLLRAKDEILAECKAWFEKWIREAAER